MKLRTSVIAKTLAWVLIAVSGLGLVGSGVLIVNMKSSGFYDQTYSDIREEKFATYNDRYSARVLEYLYAEKNTNQEYFAERNFCYGVIEANFLSEIEGMDLNDRSIYLDTNFDREVNLEDLHVFQCTINENTSFESSNPDSLLGYYWIHNTNDNWYSYNFDKFVYDLTSGIFFIKAEGEEQYYPVPQVVLHISGNEKNTVSLGFEFDKKIGAYKSVEVVPDVSFGKKQYESILEVDIDADAKDPEVSNLLLEIEKIAGEIGFAFNWLEGSVLNIENWREVNFSSSQYYFDTQMHEELPMVYDYEASSALASGIELSYVLLEPQAVMENLNKEIFMDAAEQMLYVRPTDMKYNSYFVLSYQKDSFSYNAKFMAEETDVFGKFDIVVGTLYSMRYQMIGIFFGCLAVFIIAFVFLCKAAGYKKGKDGLAEAWINRIPLELYAGVAVSAWIYFVWMADAILWRISNSADVFWIILLIVATLFAGLLLTVSALEVITRIKLRTLWKRTICCWAITKLFGGCRQAGAFVAEHTSLVLKVLLLLGANAFIDFFILLMAIDEPEVGILFFLVKTAVLFMFSLSASVQLKKLKDAGEHMAKGDLAYRVDTKGLLWDFKKHGENLNSVGEGLAIAVEERMKSERFRTELITNVSHDIKTPLTSIINYVDLMQKEEIYSEKIEEYLEVLERQSKRLKKLLEDLLEASKASAGTLQVGLETLEAGVFMVQTVGEFEEKISAQDLELIIKKPEEPVYINADGRHFWRVIDNLMNNICKYAQPNTRVYINLEATEKEVFITFRNTSRYPLNITSEELMERFVRGDESRHTEGSGLGLSIAQSLMELMHGRFELVVDGDLFKVILIFNRVQFY